MWSWRKPITAFVPSVIAPPSVHSMVEIGGFGSGTMGFLHYQVYIGWVVTEPNTAVSAQGTEEVNSAEGYEALLQDFMDQP